ncbi:MAG: BrnT family toxin [Bacteroidota bacterium]|jgi:uncharacterized DUF497 family protein
MQYVWDPEKAAGNLRKHGVSFEEAATVFDDTLSQMFYDEEHSYGEARFITMGMSSLGRLLVIGHAERADTIRIITARFATRKERKSYEEEWEER